MEHRELYVYATVQGVAHARKGIGCEDSSGGMRLAPEGGLAFAVADGHGDPACSRSALGSRAAIKIALDHLASFAQTVGERLPSASELGSLGPRIVGTWRASVLSHYEAHPPTAEELQQLGDRGRSIAERRPEHLYGTTLSAGILLPHVLVLLQQGDGCCVVIDAQGNAYCPIPEDDRCVGNMTTSLCDEDAAEHIRCAALNCTDRSPAACFMGTDGVDKSLANRDGLIGYCVELALELVEIQGEEQARHYVEEQLGVLSERGSQDDASFAGFWNPASIKALAPILEKRLEEGERLTKIELLRDKLDSMERLHKRYLNLEPASVEEQERRDQFLGEYADLVRQLNELGVDATVSIVEGAVEEPPGNRPPENVRVGGQPMKSLPSPDEKMLRRSDDLRPHADVGEMSRPRMCPEVAEPACEGAEDAAPTRALPPDRGVVARVRAPRMGNMGMGTTGRSILLAVCIALGVVTLLLCVVLGFNALSGGGTSGEVNGIGSQSTTPSEAAPEQDSADDSGGSDSDETDSFGGQGVTSTPSSTGAAPTQNSDGDFGGASGTNGEDGVSGVGLGSGDIGNTGAAPSDTTNYYNQPPVKDLSAVEGNGNGGV